MTQQKTLVLALIALLLAFFAFLTPLAYADQGGFSNSGGSATVSSGVFISSSVSSPAGTLSISCPGSSPCSGGSLTYQSTDGTTGINAVFTTGKYVEGCSGGGRGGHVTCSWSFNGSFSGTLTVNGTTQAINGATSQYFGTTGTAGYGTVAYNSAYTPFYYSDSEQILRADDLQGDNQITYGSGGSGVGNFYGAYGIALDSLGRIYVADTYNCRVVRIDDMKGTNWTEYDSAGGCGNGPNQFYEPTGIAVDSLGRIYVTDPYNAQLIRMDDITGANWTVFNNIGSGTGQLNTFTNVTVDSSNRIYVADGGNSRIIRMDDMSGTNFIALHQSPNINGYVYSFASPVALALAPNGQIYVADYAGSAEVIRVDDMTGANWASISVSAVGAGGLNSIAVDSSGIVLTGGGGAKIVDNQTAVLNSSGPIAPYGSYYIFGVTPVPLPTPRPSAVNFTPATLNFSQNVGGTSTLPLIITNFGGSPLNFTAAISASSGFAESDNCPAILTAGSNCTANVSFTPAATGSISGSLTVSDDSFNLGTSQNIALSGTGTAPVATITPSSLSFSAVEGTTSNARTVTLQNTGTGPMNIASILASSPFSQTNTCASPLVAGASCTISVTFSPTSIGSVSGTLTFNDDTGTQVVTLSGNGTSPVSLSPSSLNFGSVAVGYTSSVQSLSVTNRTNAALNFVSITASGAFAIATNTCGASIAAGANCSVGVTFTPTALGSTTGTLTFTDNALNSPQNVNLSGSGTAPVTLSTTSLSFNSTVVGSTSSARSVTLTNRTTAALSFTGVSVSGPFAIAGNTCGASINAGASCSVGVTFSPTAAGSATGTLTFADSAANSPQTVSLSGNGTAPVTFSTSTLNFGTVTVGTTSSSKSVTLTNRNNVALSIGSIVPSVSFSISSTTCGASLAAGANCSISVKFSPTATGFVNGTLTFTDSAVTSPQTVALTGTGH